MTIMQVCCKKLYKLLMKMSGHRLSWICALGTLRSGMYCLLGAKVLLRSVTQTNFRLWVMAQLLPCANSQQCVMLARTSHLRPIGTAAAGKLIIPFQV